jgi:DNA helicase-2/ATP-dependent DNA helicase PcrA
MKYSAAQIASIKDVQHNTRVTASAGAGKTGVTTGRVVKCLLTKGVEPRNIVVCAYNEDAAAVLSARIPELISKRMGPVDGMAEMFVGTLHSFCLGILQNECYRFRKHSVLSEVANRLLVSRYPSASGLAAVRYIGGKKEGQALSGEPNEVRTYLDALNVLREERIPHVSLPAGLRDALDRYHQLLDAKGFLDYTRIQVEVLSALTDISDPDNIAVQRRLAARIKYLLIDEYQDCNVIQEAIIARLQRLGATLTVCGDEDQTLYAFRGADVRNFQTFSQRYPNVREHILADNFRSTVGVVSAARAIADGIGELDPRRQPKPMRSASRHLAWDRGDMLALTFPDAEAEAAGIAHRIAALVGTPFRDTPDAEPRGLAYSDCAILLRSVKNDAGPITDALMAARIPFVLRGMANLLLPTEAEAAAVSFDFLAGHVSGEEVKGAWHRADMGLSEAELAAGTVHLERMRLWIDEWDGVCGLVDVYMGLLEAMGIYAERFGDAARGDLVMYNLARVSQAALDFETICFRTQAEEKFARFASWLRTEAVDAYEQVGDNQARLTPNAVVVGTVHKAKGCEWPAVFVPAMQEGRFPFVQTWPDAKWSLLPRHLVKGAGRYDGSLADERRLFYVALTRAQKYLWCSWSPSVSKKHLRSASSFFNEFSGHDAVLTVEPNPSLGGEAEKIEARPREDAHSLSVTITQLKYYHMCPYQFRLKYVYGFASPPREEMGLGKSIHDATAELHQRTVNGESVLPTDLVALVERHLHLPFAGPKTIKRLGLEAHKSVRNYVERFGHALRQVVMVEKPIEISAGGITIAGRIDVVKRLDTGETSIVEQKTSEEAQALEVTRIQLGLQSLGFQALTGKANDLIEVQQMNANGSHHREMVDAGMLAVAEGQASTAGEAIRTGRLPRLKVVCGTCKNCDPKGVCRTWHERDKGGKESVD